MVRIETYFREITDLISSWSSLLAYDFFPKSADEIEKKLKHVQKDSLKEIVSLFNYLVKFDPTPINIDKATPKNINVSRKLKGQFGDVKKIANGAKVRSLKLKFGNGSSGNRGSNNRGTAFEGVFMKDLRQWWEGKTQFVDKKNLTAIEDLDRTYGLSNNKRFDIVAEGSSNTKRPLVFSQSSISLLNAKGSGYNVGKSISDITLKTDKEEIYLSLKMGGTVTFFNVGVRTILTPTEIKEGKINNPNGRRLLDMFGIDYSKFCKVFTTGYSEVDTRARANKNNIETLLKSGIGYGYHIIHVFPRTIESTKMDRRTMEKASSIGDVTVYYGGLTGNGKRIDIKFESSFYNFKLNIRDTQGTDGFPTRLMCDFTHA